MIGTCADGSTIRDASTNKSYLDKPMPLVDCSGNTPGTILGVHTINSYLVMIQRQPGGVRVRIIDHVLANYTSYWLGTILGGGALNSYLVLTACWLRGDIRFGTWSV